MSSSIKDIEVKLKTSIEKYAKKTIPTLSCSTSDANNNAQTATDQTVVSSNEKKILPKKS